MAYQYWLDELSLLAKNTRRNYKHYFQKYLDAEGISAEELYEWQKRLLDDGDPRTNREVARSVAHFVADMVEDGYSTGTSHIVANAVRSFMKANGLSFPLRKRDLPKITTRGSKVVLLEEIRALWDSVPNEFKLRNRAILMVLKDTGLRVSDVAALTCEAYRGARTVETENGVFKVFVPMVTVKTGEIAHIHIGPESVEAIDEYLDGRQTGPLFIDRKDEALSDEALTVLILRAVERLPELDGVSAHSFRKTHRTLLEARIPESYVKKLQGKATDPYIHPEQTGELTKAYIENYDALRVFNESIELEEMKKTIETLKQNNVGYNALQAQVQLLTKLIAEKGYASEELIKLIQIQTNIEKKE